MNNNLTTLTGDPVKQVIQQNNPTYIDPLEQLNLFNDNRLLA